MCGFPSESAVTEHTKSGLSAHVKFATGLSLGLRRSAVWDLVVGRLGGRDAEAGWSVGGLGEGGLDGGGLDGVGSGGTGFGAAGTGTEVDWTGMSRTDSREGGLFTTSL